MMLMVSITIFLMLLSITRNFQNPVQNYFAVTILVNASKPRFKGSYSDVRRSPHRMHSISVRRGPRLSFDGAKVQYRTDTRSQSCQKNAKKCTFL